MIQLFESHTGRYIKERILDILKEFEIEMENVFSITSDNGRNMVKAIELFNDEATDQSIFDDRNTDDVMKELDSINFSTVHLVSIDGAQDTHLSRPTVQYVEQQAFEQLLRSAPGDPTPTSEQGLLDTGANISCIGADLAARDWSSFKQFRKISSHVRTADGGSQAVTGTLNVEVAYNNAKHPVTFFVIPTIEKRVILGIDFWKTFQLVPGLISAIDPPISTVESPPDNEESFPLTQIQKKRLDGTMCRLVDELIPADLKHCVFGYLDDVCVISEDFDTHLSVLLRLSEQFRKANLTLNIAKSRFCVTEVQYLGFVIGRGGIATYPSKVDAIRSWPSPKTLKQARRFLGLVGWYRQFIQNFAEVVFPITELLSTKKNVTERECLSAVLAIEKFRCYLELQEFELITDHASLLWLMRQPNLKVQDCKSAWRSLRDSYKYHIKASEKKRAKSGSAGGVGPQPPMANEAVEWHLAPYMAFLPELSMQTRTYCSALDDVPSTSQGIIPEGSNWDLQFEANASMDASQASYVEDGLDASNTSCENTSAYSYERASKRAKVDKTGSKEVFSQIHSLIDKQVEMLSVARSGALPAALYWSDIIRGFEPEMARRATNAVTQMLLNFENAISNNVTPQTSTFGPSEH
ncbi:hypothetical protein ACLKA6_002587 [Drosophila palustris]